jgi:hypothetical protein
MNPLGQAASYTGNVLDQLAAWFQDNTVDIMVKTGAVILVLFGLYFIPATRKFATATALILLFLILIASSPDNSQTTAADSTLPLPTQIGTPTPPPAGSGASSSGSSGGSGIGGLIGDIASVLPFFA